MLGKFGGITKLIFYIFAPSLFKKRSHATAHIRISEFYSTDNSVLLASDCSLVSQLAFGVLIECCWICS